MKLISNSFEYKINKEEATLYYSENPHPLAKRVTKEKYTEVINSIASNGNKLEFTDECKHFYYSLYPLDGIEKSILVKINSNKTIRREFVKWSLYATLKDTFIIDFTRFGSDISIYRQNQKSQWDGWNSFSSYNFIIRDWEIHLSIGSKNTLISQQPITDFTFNGQPVYKALVNNHIIHREHLTDGSYPSLASQEVRIYEKLMSRPQFPNYSAYYDEIRAIYSEVIELEFGDVIIMRDGFSRLQENKDFFSVTRSYNVMVFKNKQTNVNASNGMRNDGPFAPPEMDLKNLEFIFVYPNSEKAKELFIAFRNGKTSYFPGLERFVEIPIRQPSKELILKYDYTDYEQLPQLVDTHVKSVKQKMPGKSFFAIVLLPKSKKDETIEEQAEYFELKYTLLQNEIPSQFIDERAISTDNFVYWLPNLAIAIQAKLGGIPWKLNRDEDKELIVGFGDASQADNDYLGSTVFFDNSGKLRASTFFRNDNIEAFKQTLRDALLDFIQNMAQRPERLIIHYFKIPGNKEKDAIYDAIKGMGLDIPFIIVTIYDTKAKDYLAFDESYGYGMPMSGTAWRINRHEYILFNNTRYEERPRSGKPPKQEFPIKLKIWFSNKQHSSDEQLKRIIGQVFEFSRIYWKSVQQQSKPVTAVYPEMIAEFGSKFGNNPIPENVLTQNTPWFI